MLPTYPYATCRLNIVSTLADTIFGHVANMSADMSANMSATCQANTHMSVDSTIFSTFKNPTFPAKVIGDPEGIISDGNVRGPEGQSSNATPTDTSATVTASSYWIIAGCGLDAEEDVKVSEG